MSRFLSYAILEAMLAALVVTVGTGTVKAQTSRTVDNFEQYEIGRPPGQWVYVQSRNDIRPVAEALEPGERFEVAAEDGNQFVRLYTDGEYIRFSQRNGKEFDWNLATHPRLSWRWRANALPEGASERDQNDTGGAVYVTFGTDWLGRPKSIKYTYSSTLPVGTVVDFGTLYVIVISSGKQRGTGSWKTVTRNVVQDYRQVFGERPPDRPVGISLSGDSNTTGSTSEVDIDDITLLPPR